MTFQTIYASRPLSLVSLVIAAVLCSCGSSKMAFEGNPMPDEQVAKFLQVVSPRSVYDTAPVFKRGYSPFFPEAESMKRQWGYAMTEFTITPAGHVDDVKIPAATALTFAQEAWLAIQDWRFVPAQKNGAAVPVRARIPFTFRTGAPSGHKITREAPAQR